MLKNEITGFWKKTPYYSKYSRPNIKEMENLPRSYAQLVNCFFIVQFLLDFLLW